MLPGAQPLTIGPANALALVGAGWEWCRDQAVRLGVPLLGTRRKQLVSAAAFLAALERDTAAPAGSVTVVADPAAEVRRRLGVRRASDSRSGASAAFRPDSSSTAAIAPAVAPRVAQ
jgi:hypothetical protein